MITLPAYLGGRWEALNYIIFGSFKIINSTDEGVGQSIPPLIRLILVVRSLITHASAPGGLVRRGEEQKDIRGQAGKTDRDGYQTELPNQRGTFISIHRLAACSPLAIPPLRRSLPTLELSLGRRNRPKLEMSNATV
jgi:hypothetical protein